MLVNLKKVTEQIKENAIEEVDLSYANRLQQYVTNRSGYHAEGLNSGVVAAGWLTAYRDSYWLIGKDGSFKYVSLGRHHYQTAGAYKTSKITREVSAALDLEYLSPAAHHCRFMIGTPNGEVILMNLGWETYPSVKLDNAHTQEVTQFAFFPDQSQIVSSSLDGTLRTYNPYHWNYDKQQLFCDTKKPVLAIAVWGQRIASASDEGSIDIWDIATGKQVGKTMVCPTAPAAVSRRCLKVLADGRLMSGHSDGVVRFWDPEEHECVGEIKLADCAISQLFISAEGYCFAGAGKTLYPFDPTSKHVLEAINSTAPSRIDHATGHTYFSKESITLRGEVGPLFELPQRHTYYQLFATHANSAGANVVEFYRDQLVIGPEEDFLKVLKENTSVKRINFAGCSPSWLYRNISAINQMVEKRPDIKFIVTTLPEKASSAPHYYFSETFLNNIVDAKPPETARQKRERLLQEQKTELELTRTKELLVWQLKLIFCEKKLEVSCKKYAETSARFAAFISESQDEKSAMQSDLEARATDVDQLHWQLNRAGAIIEELQKEKRALQDSNNILTIALDTGMQELEQDYQRQTEDFKLSCQVRGVLANYRLWEIVQINSQLTPEIFQELENSSRNELKEFHHLNLIRWSENQDICHIAKDLREAGAILEVRELFDRISQVGDYTNKFDRDMLNCALEQFSQDFLKGELPQSALADLDKLIGTAERRSQWKKLQSKHVRESVREFLDTADTVAIIDQQMFPHFVEKITTDNPLYDPYSEYLHNPNLLSQLRNRHDLLDQVEDLEEIFVCLSQDMTRLMLADKNYLETQSANVSALLVNHLKGWEPYRDIYRHQAKTFDEVICAMILEQINMLQEKLRINPERILAVSRSSTALFKSFKSLSPAVNESTKVFGLGQSMS